MRGRHVAALAAIPVALLVMSGCAGVLYMGAAGLARQAATSAEAATPVVAVCAGAPATQEVGRWDAEQTRNAAIIVQVGRSLGIPERGWLIGIATAMQESGLRNLNYGDGTSVGLFQLIAIHGSVAERIDPVFSATWFFRGLRTIDGWETMPLTLAAQAVQRSAFPLAYAKWETAAGALLKAITGADPAACVDPAPGPWVMPVAAYTITARFGQPGGRWAANHTGLDLAAPEGTPVGAASAGQVVAITTGGPYGNLVKVRHAAGVETWYAHLSAVEATAGQTVAPGGTIGRVGATGNTTGPHLHLEVRVAGVPVDPETWLTSHGVKP
jgi:hypothetical protein